jgi:starch phosphorylase
VAIVDVEGDVTAGRVGAERSIVARVRTGHLSPEDISVQLAHGRVGGSGSLIAPQIVPMAMVDRYDDVFTYRGTFTTTAAGLYGFAVRAVPAHEDLASPMELGLVNWA